MSCLPDIFITSKSQNLLPNKVGGQFSIHLRSALFSNKQIDGRSAASSFQSADAKRYKSWIDSQQTFKKTRRSSKSYFHRQEKTSNKMIQEKGFVHENINARQRQQSEVEAISNFNILKRSVMQNVHLSQKVLDHTQSQIQNIRQQMEGYKHFMLQEMHQYQDKSIQSLAVLSKVFREQRRNMISEGKALALQIRALEEQIGTTAEILNEMQRTFCTVITQFL